MINDEKLGGDLKQPRLISGGKNQDRSSTDQSTSRFKHVHTDTAGPSGRGLESTRKPEHSARWIRAFFDISSDVSPGLPTNGKLTVFKMNEFRRHISLDSEKVSYLDSIGISTSPESMSILINVVISTEGRPRHLENL